MGPDLATTPLTPSGGSMWSYKAEDSGNIEGPFFSNSSASSSDNNHQAAGGQQPQQQPMPQQQQQQQQQPMPQQAMGQQQPPRNGNGAPLSYAAGGEPMNGGGGAMWQASSGARSPLPPKPVGAPPVRPNLRVNVSLPPVEKMQGTGLRIRAWDPTQDPVVSPRHADWNDVDPRLSPLSFNVSSPISTYSNSPESDLESSFSSLFLENSTNSVETPTAEDAAAFSRARLGGTATGLRSRPPSAQGMGPPHDYHVHPSHANHHGPSPHHHPLSARGGGLNPPNRSSPSPRGHMGHPYAHLSGQGSPRWGGPQGSQQHIPPHHQQYAQPRTAARHGMGQPGGRRTPKGGMGLGGLYSPIPSSPVGGYDDYFGSGGCSEGDLETKRCSNVIKKLCTAGNITEVFTVLEDMLSRGLVPDLKTVKTIMRTCVKKLAWRRALQLLHTAGLPLDVVIYTMAINTCGKAGEWEQGLRVLREMDESKGLGPNEVSYGTAISACGKAGRWELALSLLAEMKGRGFVLNDVCYGGAIDACGRAGQWQEALKLLHEMSMEGVAPNEVCYNSAISACGKAGEWEKAVALLREMRDRGLTPDELNYNSAISACGKAAQWNHAVRLLREMSEQGLSPDVVSYGAAIDACRKAGKFDRGLDLLNEMREVGLAPNEVCYHSAVTACSEAGRWSEALLVLSEMMKQGLKPDAISYNAAVEACAKSSKWEPLVVLLQETGRDPDTTLIEAVFNNAVVTCSKYGNLELAANVLQEMEYRGLTPTLASYSSVIDAGLKAQQWELILAKMDAMREKGLLPDASTYNAAVRACGHADQWKKAVRLLQEMSNRSYPCDQATYNTLLSAANMGGREWDPCLSLLHDMAREGLAPMPRANSYNAQLDNAAQARSGQWEHTLNLLAQMARSEDGHVPMSSPRSMQGGANTLSGMRAQRSHSSNSLMNAANSGAGPHLHQQQHQHQHQAPHHQDAMYLNPKLGGLSLKNLAVDPRMEPPRPSPTARTVTPVSSPRVGLKVEDLSGGAAMAKPEPSTASSSGGSGFTNSPTTGAEGDEHHASMYGFDMSWLK